MATDNPRVAAYLLPQIFERLSAFSQEHDLSVSQAINRILAEYFGISTSDTLGSIQSSLSGWSARLAAVEAELEKSRA